MKILLLTILVTLTLSAFEVQKADTHKRVVPNGQNLHKIISWSGMLDDAIGAVVNIRIYKNDKAIGVGSGVIISKNGYIVTNEHVVHRSDKIYVYLHSKAKKIKAKLIGTDKANDVAVIQIRSHNLNPIKFADSDAIELTDLVFTIGNGYGLGKTVSQGIVSALHKRELGIYEYENLIQTDAVINPGNSGGALVNNQGELIGINSAKIARVGVSGIGFAIPSNTVQIITKAIIENGKFERGYLGISFKQKNEGIVTVESIDKKSIAYTNGIRVGDQLISFDSKEIFTPGDAIYILGLKQPGESVIIEYSHKGKIINKIVRLGKR
ncbi:S1C family serine protease [Sulfurimonas paralvinellae]|uniref:Trypsin-like serine protease n=1 Tax=Sulfurimonas paralvinellae TaxID=317658 RepID=A0A7M1B925_9BACT|nr:trypsin-like peptidase domain-containing protein [Sulfurimonas paralvinellae]QOP46175.1 trypsin-like serine protease [Sulfurimonas paralvinellae]